MVTQTNTFAMWSGPPTICFSVRTIKVRILNSVVRKSYCGKVFMRDDNSRGKIFRIKIILCGINSFTADASYFEVAEKDILCS
jgi:hypothetical protein